MSTIPYPDFTDASERRADPRLRYSWQMYFQHPEDGSTAQGRMIDLSASGAAFLAGIDADLWPRKRLFLRITHPIVCGGAFDVREVRRSAEVLRIEPFTHNQNRVAVRLTTPLDYDPAGDAADVCHDMTMAHP